jgi:hypothetical protein
VKQLTPEYYPETNLTSVRHIHIENEEAINNCIYYFPNATDLTLRYFSSIKPNSSIINLKNLSKLNIACYNYSFKKLIKLLSITSNIVTLTIDHIRLDMKDFETIRNDESFQTVSKVNIIRNLTVTSVSEVKEVELLFILCPRLQHFTTDSVLQCFETIIHLLVFIDNDITQHLISLRIPVVDKIYVDRLKKLIQAGKLLNDCLIKFQYNQLYLWRKYFIGDRAFYFSNIHYIC